MKIELSLFGAFREFDALVVLELPAGARVADLRAALQAHGEAHWPRFQAALLARSAFASESAVLRDHEPLPDNGRMAILPPVSGG